MHDPAFQLLSLIESMDYLDALAKNRLLSSLLAKKNLPSLSISDMFQDPVSTSSQLLNKQEISNLEELFLASDFHTLLKDALVVINDTPMADQDVDETDLNTLLLLEQELLDLQKTADESHSRDDEWDHFWNPESARINTDDIEAEALWEALWSNPCTHRLEHPVEIVLICPSASGLSAFFLSSGSVVLLPTQLEPFSVESTPLGSLHHWNDEAAIAPFFTHSSFDEAPLWKEALIRHAQRNRPEPHALFAIRIDFARSAPNMCAETLSNNSRLIHRAHELQATGLCSSVKQDLSLKWPAQSCQNAWPWFAPQRRKIQSYAQHHSSWKCSWELLYGEANVQAAALIKHTASLNSSGSGGLQGVLKTALHLRAEQSSGETIHPSCSLSLEEEQRPRFKSTPALNSTVQKEQQLRLNLTAERELNLSWRFEAQGNLLESSLDLNSDMTLSNTLSGSTELELRIFFDKLTTLKLCWDQNPTVVMKTPTETQSVKYTIEAEDEILTRSQSTPLSVTHQDWISELEKPDVTELIKHDLTLKRRQNLNIIRASKKEC